MRPPVMRTTEPGQAQWEWVFRTSRLTDLIA